MDLTPSIGRQELLDSLSQQSSQSGKRSDNRSSARSLTSTSRSVASGTQRSMTSASRSNRSATHRQRVQNNSSSSSSSNKQLQTTTQPLHEQLQQLSAHTTTRNQQSSNATQQQQPAAAAAAGAGNGDTSHHRSGSGSQYLNVDEAYRRLGHRLSLQAHGIDDLSVASSLTTVTSAAGSLRHPAIPPPPRIQLRASASSGFGGYEKDQNSRAIQQQSSSALHPLASPASPALARSSKSQKNDYGDHGHGTPTQRSNNSRLLIRLTCMASELFRKWQDLELRHEKQQANTKRVSIQQQESLSPQHQFGAAFSQMGLSSNSTRQPPQLPQQQLFQQQQQLQFQQQQQQLLAGTTAGIGGFAATSAQHFQAQQQHFQQRQQQFQHGIHGQSTLSVTARSKGLLSAVLEGCSDSNTSGTNGNGGGGTGSTITSKDDTAGSKQAPGTAAPAAAPTAAAVSSTTTSGATTGAATSNGADTGLKATGASAISTPETTRGACLTSPSHGVANQGLDNVEGNLIVYEQDVFVIPKKSIHTIHKQQKKTSSVSAATTEYRVLKLLGQGTFAQVFECTEIPSNRTVAVKVVKNKPAYTRQATVEIDVFRALFDDDDQQQPTQPRRNNRDYMVNLICYFMHQSHLCLVFELLGLNLYEVLKKRQFRGLPLTLVQSVMRQAIGGVKDLTRKNVVHCDLKPENVLLVSSDVVKSVVTAGESTAALTLQQQKRQQQQLKPESSPGTTTSSTIAVAAGTTTTSSSAEDATTAGGTSKGTGGSSRGTGGSNSSGGITVQTGNIGGNRSAAGDAEPDPPARIKLIDFGSACFEGHAAHTYIQSRFYRSPEVLVGIPYDSAIDMWSLGCVAAELFLGLPILPGVHEHDQLGRTEEMISKLPSWMLEQGSKANKFYVKYLSTSGSSSSRNRQQPSPVSAASQQSQLKWRLKTQKEYIDSLSQSEIIKKGGLNKLEKQPGHRYFKRTKLADILVLHAAQTISTASNSEVALEEKKLVPAFVHFLYGILDPDPWKRWTAFQAVQHPFLTGNTNQIRKKTVEFVAQLDNLKEENQANVQLDVYWQAPWDPAICKRKLLNVQKVREKQQSSGAQKQRSKEQQRGRQQQIAASRGDNASSAQQSRASVESPPMKISQQQTGKVTSSASFAAGMGASGAQASVVSGGTQSVASFHVMAPTGGTGVPHHEADFAYVLQRPGVVPGTSMNSSHYGATTPMSQLVAASGTPMSTVPATQHGSSCAMSAVSMPLQTGTNRSTPQGGGSSNRSPSVATSTGHAATVAGNLPFNNVAHQQQATATLHGSGRQSVASSVGSTSAMGGLVQTNTITPGAFQQQAGITGLPGGMVTTNNMYAAAQLQQHGQAFGQQLQQTPQGFMYVQQPPQQQFQQPPQQILQQPHQQFVMQQTPQQQQQQQQQQMQQQGTPLTHQQQGQMAAQTPQQQPQQQQAVHQFASPHQLTSPPQQPVYLANAPGGGYYYVTSSAPGMPTGQPMFVQQMGVPQQQQQLMPPPPNMPPQQQQLSYAVDPATGMLIQQQQPQQMAYTTAAGMPPMMQQQYYSTPQQQQPMHYQQQWQMQPQQQMYQQQQYAPQQQWQQHHQQR